MTGTLLNGITDTDKLFFYSKHSNNCLKKKCNKILKKRRLNFQNEKNQRSNTESLKVCFQYHSII